MYYARKIFLTTFLLVLLISCDRRPFPTYSTVVKFNIAVKNNDMEEVKKYIKEYKDICMFEMRNFDGSSLNAVSSAVMSENIEMLKLVLKHKAAIDYLNMPGEFTALSLAVEKNDKEMMRYLIENSADVTIVDLKRNTILHDVCLFFRDVEVLDYLSTSVGSLLEERNKDNMTPLYAAILEDPEAVPPKLRNPEVVKWLLDHGADVHGVIGRNKEWDVIVPLIERKDNEYLKMIFSYAKKPLPITIHNNMNYLQLSIWHQNWDMVPVFLPLVDDVNHQDGEGRTALHIAGYFDDVDTIQYLIENGVDPEIKDTLGRTAYDIYVETNAVTNPEIVALLKK